MIPSPMKHVCGRKVELDRMGSIPSCVDMDSDVGLNQAMIATRKISNRTHIRDVLARSAMSYTRKTI